MQHEDTQQQTTEGRDVADIIDALDWSHYQKFVNFERLRKATIEGRPVRRAFVRAGQGTTPDKFFARNWAGLLEMGWRRGSYWVSDPSVKGVEQARKYWGIIKPEQGDYKLGPDLELPVSAVTRAQKANHWAFVLELEQLSGYPPMVYSRATWLDPLWEGEDYSRFAFWGAGYPTLLIPKGWKKAAMHQYTSKGRMDGIEGDVDFNYILDEDAILLPSKAQTLPDTFPTSAKTSSIAYGYRRTTESADTLYSIDLADVEVTVHDVDDTKQFALTSMTSLQAWVPIRQLKFDAVPRPEPLPVTPQPPTVQPIKLGYNCLNAGLAMAKADAGCRFFMLQDISVARQIKRKYPDAVVMVRWYHSQRVTADDIVRALSPSLDDELVFTGLNECDWLCYGTVDQIRERAALDVAVAQRIRERSPRSVYAAGTFSVGTPNYIVPDICEAMRQLYAPHYNSGLLSIDYHSYTPSPTGGFDVWHARRWQWLFDKCGFDVGSTSRIYSGETGVDDGRGNGFAGVGATQAQVNDWVIRFKALQAQPVNGKPSPFVGGAVFCLGENGDKRWIKFKADGYEVFR